MTTEPPAEPPPQSRFPATEDFPTGPDVGERLPEFALRDQRGNLVNFTEARRGRRALVVFHRSARW